LPLFAGEIPQFTAFSGKIYAAAAKERHKSAQLCLALMIKAVYNGKRFPPKVVLLHPLLAG